MSRKNFLMKNIFITFYLISLITFNYAYSFSYNGEIISEGDSKFDILSKYGKPALTNSSVTEIINNTEEKDLLNGEINLEDIKDSGKKGFLIYVIIKYINIDEWTYDFGENLH